MNKRVTFKNLSPLITDQLLNGGEVILVVSGTSMLPLLRPGRDRVVLGAPPKGALRVTDLPLYRRADGKYVLHRVLRIFPDGSYGMAGDHQTNLEYQVQPEQILGLVRGFWRKEHYYSCCQWNYRLYSWFWVKAFPARRFLLCFKSVGARILKKGKANRDA